MANLADNAIRYNSPGGRVDITGGMRGDRPFLGVANTGPVIPADQLGRLFQPFQRLHQARTGPGSSGLGLGLAIVSAVAAAHGAELRALPQAGRAPRRGLVSVRSRPPRQIRTRGTGRSPRVGPWGDHHGRG